MLDSIPAIPIWVGILLVLVGGFGLFAKGSRRVLAVVTMAVGVFVCFHGPPKEGPTNDGKAVPPTEGSSASSSDPLLATMGPEVRKAIMYLADQLEKHPAMQAYVLPRSIVATDDTMVVVQNGASRTILQGLPVSFGHGSGCRHGGPQERTGRCPSRVRPN
jgi:hypothetical protein